VRPGFEYFSEESPEIKEELEYLQEIKHPENAKFLNKINSLASITDRKRPAFNRFCPTLNRIRPGFYRLLSSLRSPRLECLSTAPDPRLRAVRRPLSSF
jgi:hypothetical protein